CASATLIEKHEIRRKRKAGLAGVRRGQQAAALDAAGAALGSVWHAGICDWLFLDGGKQHPRRLHGRVTRLAHCRGSGLACAAKGMVYTTKSRQLRDVTAPLALIGRLRNQAPLTLLRKASGARGGGDPAETPGGKVHPACKIHGRP